MLKGVAGGSSGGAASSITVGTTTISNGTSGRILYDNAGVLGESANLLYDNANTRFTVGSGSTSAQGVTAGFISSSISGIWDTRVSGSEATTNSRMLFANDTYVGAPAGASIIFFQGGSLAAKMQINATAGNGPTITAGTATTDVAAFSLTRTNNNAAVATGVKWTFTDTISSAAFKLFQILGTSSASEVYSMDKIGQNVYTDVGNTSGFKFASYVSNSVEAGNVVRVAQTAAVVFTTTSDYRTKDLFGAYKDASAKLRQFKVYEGKFKGDTMRRPMLVAHEVADVTPGAVFGGKDAIETVDIFTEIEKHVFNPKTLELDLVTTKEKTGEREIPSYQKMIVGGQESLLIAGWQEQDSLIAALQSQVKALEARLSAAGIK